MPNIQIRGQTVDIDIEAELRNYEWERPRWSSDKLICASPFRFDRNPSFFASLETGGWHDSGAFEQEFSSGNLTKLLAFLRNETYEEAEDYLLDTYGLTIERGAQLTLTPPKLRLVQRNRQPLNSDVLSSYHAGPCEYLRGRGISDEVQRSAGVCYDPAQKAVVIPWRFADGRLANVKYRSTYSKVFWYRRGATPIRELVWGVEQAEAITVICEAEIDAMTWRTAGFAAIAVGGAHFTKAQADIIKRSPIESLYVAGDNDKAGQKFTAEIMAMFTGYVETRSVEWHGCDEKDANEVLVRRGSEALRKLITEAVPSKVSFNL